MGGVGFGISGNVMRRLRVAVIGIAMIGAGTAVWLAHGSGQPAAVTGQRNVVPHLAPDVGTLHAGSQGPTSSPKVEHRTGIVLIPSAGGPVTAYGGAPGAPTFVPAQKRSPGSAGSAASSTTLPACLTTPRKGSVLPKGATGCRTLGIHSAAQDSEAMGWAFKVTNSYQGTYRGRAMTVWAGGKCAIAEPNCPVQGGGVRVSLDGGPTKQYLAPRIGGVLTITSVKDDLVNLRGANGDTPTFNLATHRYTGGLRAM